MNYKLSVMLCNYNNAWCIERALNSIPKRNDIQIVIVDDCSTDNSDELIRKYIQDNPIFGYKYIKNNKNIGLGLSRKIAQSFIEGEYFTILDCDDWLITDKFNDVINNHLNNNYDLVYFYMTHGSHKAIILASQRTYRNFSGHNKIYRTAFINNSGAEWHNVRKGSDVDFDRQWWDKNPSMHFTDILAKHWNRPNEKFSNLSTHGAKNRKELLKKAAEESNSNDKDIQLRRTIIKNRNDDNFLKNFKPEYDEVEYTYEVIV